MKPLFLIVTLVIGLSGCQLSPTQKNTHFVGPRKTLEPEYASLALLLQRYLTLCQNNQVVEQQKPEPYIGQAAIETFIHSYCNTVSTTRQLQAIAKIKQSQHWPQHYHLWLDTLKQHTQVLRGQKIRLHRSNAKLSQIQTQLTQTNQALLTLKQELADIEQQRLQDIPQNAPHQTPSEQP